MYGQRIRHLRSEYLILFKAKTYLDLKSKKEAGEAVGSNDIKKHKKDILRISAELTLEKIENLPKKVETDIYQFIDNLEREPFDSNSLKIYGLSNDDIVQFLRERFT